MIKETITLSNVGPIAKLDIPLPDNGGIVVLRGGQGEGKSTALRAVSRVLVALTAEAVDGDIHAEIH